MKTNYPDSLTIQQYLEGKLDPEVMHQLEKQALDDPFLWDALEGYSTYADSAAELSILQRQLHERIVHLQENKKIFDLTWQRLSVAAAAAVLFITAGILFWMNGSNQDPQIASNPKQVEVMLSDPDSLLASSADTSISANESLAGAQLSGNGAAKSANDRIASASPERRVIQADKTRIGADNSAARPDAVGEYAARNNTSSAAAKTAAQNPEVRSARVQDAAPGNIVQPVAGWDLYRQYLKLNVRPPADQPVLSGTVLLTLDVASDGRIKDVKVIKGLSDAYNSEAIRLVKEGPVWKGSADGETKQVRLEVVF